MIILTAKNAKVKKLWKGEYQWWYQARGSLLNADYIPCNDEETEWKHMYREIKVKIYITKEKENN